MLSLNCKLPADITATVTSDLDLGVTPYEDLLLRAYLPGLHRIEALTERPDIHIRHIQSEERGLHRDGLELTLRDVWRGKIGADLYHLFAGACRVKLFDHGMYSVHAACVGKDDQILIVGHSGSGKTSTALELASRHGRKVASGNKTVVAFDAKNQIRVCAGTTTMTVRSSEEGKQMAQKLGKTSEQYGERIAFSIDDDHFVDVPDLPIRGIAIVRLHDGLQDTHRLSETSALHTLYPYFMDTVNADVLVAGGKGIFVGTPPIGTQEKLSNGLAAALTEIPVYSVAGSLEYVAENISRI